MRNFIILLSSVFFLVLTSIAEDLGKPALRIEKVFNEIKETIRLNEEKLSPEALEVELEKIVSPAFDFREMSKRCLGANWKKANEAEQEEFVDLFSDLLLRNYVKKIRENIAESEVSVTDEATKGKRAVVKTSVETGSDKVSLDYRLRLKDSSWVVYDVIIENIGLVSNYRSEFGDIVRKEKMSGLLKKLREKEVKI